jgi:protein-disulfide isomerase/uncharacterized membrane protein
LAPASSGFCSAHSGCESVRRSGLTFLFWPWLNVPLIGVLAYTTVLCASLLPETRVWARNFAVAGGVFALGFLGVQAFVIRSFCWLCVVVDSAALIAALLSLKWFAGTHAMNPLKPWAWGSLAGMAILAPVGWGAARSEVPPEILALYEPGKINVVEFSDFECPFCRRAHPVLEEVAKSYGDRVHFHRLHMPLDHAHPYARGAALAALCGAAQGRQKEMEDALFRMDLDEHAGTTAAKELGLDLPLFERCVASDDTTARLQKDIDLVQRVGLEGLPTTYIGMTRWIGARSDAEFRDAFERASRTQTGGIPGPAYIVVWIALALGVAFIGRRPTT